jgi:hypothetical protein
MKHLMRYEGYTSMERVDDILDKISKYGIKSLTKLEKDFLDSHKIGNEEELHDKLAKEESETVFEDDNNYFKFEHSKTEDYGDEVHYIGILYVPDLEWPNGKRIEGRLEGRIVAYKNGQNSLEFEKNQYDIFEFCNGLEYELDSFIDYVVSELDDKNKDL